jgi:hypothetical protein
VFPDRSLRKSAHASFHDASFAIDASGGQIEPPVSSNSQHHQAYTGENSMLFHITQVHTPETCPKNEGGSNSLFNPNVPGIKLIGRYGANAQHTLFFIVEADDVNAIHKFLWPGFKICTSTVTPVSEVPVPKD